KPTPSGRKRLKKDGGDARAISAYNGDMARVFVINEPFVDNFCRTQRWAARTRGRVLRAPDWLAYVTAVLEQRRHDVSLYDFPARGWGKPELKELLERERPEYVIYDATTPSIYSDIDCA